MQGQHELCNAFLNSYLQWSIDFEGVPLLALYLSRQAYVKAKITSFGWKDAHIGHKDHESLAIEAKKHYQLARDVIFPRKGIAIVSAKVTETVCITSQTLS